MAHLVKLAQSSKAVLLIVIIAVIYAQQTESCTEDEFKCSSSKCISKDLACDGENDCGDFSDEINCTNRDNCNLDEFECSDGSCISTSFVCNGKWECPRGLDETNCESKTRAPTTPSFEKIGIFRAADGKVKSFPVFDKTQGINIYLRFTAYRCAGKLFEMSSQNTDQFFLFSLTGNGNIEFLFMTSSGPGMVVIPPPPGDSFCNGKRHMLSVRRYLEELRYRVNRRRSVTKKIGLLREPFSKPFRVYVGTTLEGCVSGIDVIFYRTRSKKYSVGFSKGCAKPKKTTPFPPTTTAPTFNTSTSVRKESIVRSSSSSSPTSRASKQDATTEETSPKGITTHGGTPVTQHKRVTHSLPVTFPASTSGTFTRVYTTQGAQAQTTHVTRAQKSSVTQSDDVMDPYHVGQREIVSTRSNPSLRTKYVTSHATASQNSGPKGSSGSNNVTHSSSALESKTVTTTSIISTFQRATKELPDLERCEPLRSRFCTYMGYNQTKLPNRAGFRNQVQAEKQMSRFLPFIRANCSRVLKDFVCVSYLPPCSRSQSPAIQPCRELCLRSQRECASLMKAFEFEWPESLDCQKLPSSVNEKCVMAHDTSMSVVPTLTTQDNRNPVTANKANKRRTVNPFIFTRKNQTSSWKLSKSCGGILTRSSGTITSPNFPKPYPSDTLCKWAIILPKFYHVIDIILEEVSLEAGVSCGYDYLLFLDGLSNQVGSRICGFLAYPRVITVKGNMASIVFRSDSALNKKGVLLKYKAHSYP